uniref:Uncharacterized protein n=1 Tax=Ditylenchus dipsaci TaxID=166011 RepID=A0A915EA12_9BILA
MTKLECCIPIRRIGVDPLKHNKASGELNEQNIINDDLHDKYLKTQSLYLDQRGALEKSYNDYVTDVMDSTAKLYTKFNDLMKLELKQRAEDILDRNQKELAESKKPNETFDMK